MEDDGGFSRSAIQFPAQNNFTATVVFNWLALINTAMDKSCLLSKQDSKSFWSPWPRKLIWIFVDLIRNDRNESIWFELIWVDLIWADLSWFD